MPNRFAHVSLRLRLVAAITLVMVLTLAAGLALTYVHARRKVDVEMAAAMVGGRAIVEREVEELDATPEPARDLPGLVRVFNGSRHIRAQLVDADGAVLYASTQDISEAGIPGPLLNVLAGPAQVFRREVTLASGRRGAVVLESDARSEVGEVSGDAALDLTVLLILFVLVLLAVNGILTRALGSLDALTLAFERIGRGDYEVRVAEAGPPEFARLAGNCNAMAERLGQFDAHARRLSLQLSKVQDEERADLARNLHDEISPFLFAVDVDAAAIARLVAGLRDPHGTDVAARAAAIREATAHMKGEVKSLLGRLRPSVVPDLGLVEAIEDLVARARTRHPHAVIRAEVTAGPLDAATETLIHHVVREALSNALQHGDPRHVEIMVAEADETICVRIGDDGCGLAPAPAPARDGPRLPGFGVLGMRERVEARGGRFSLTGQAPEGGVLVEAILSRHQAPDARSAQPAGPSADARAEVSA